MKYTVSGIYSVDLSGTSSGVDVPFSEALSERLAGLNWLSPIQWIIFHPIVMHPQIGKIPDGISYKRGEPAVQISVNIQHAQWLTASTRQRIDLHAGAISAGLMLVKETKLLPQERSQLLGLIEEVRRVLGTAEGTALNSKIDQPMPDVVPGQERPEKIVRMYRRSDLAYHDLIDGGRVVLRHFGKLGDAGQTRIQDLAQASVSDAMRVMVQELRDEGFVRVSADDYVSLVVVYRLDAKLASKEDLKKRHQVEDRLNKVLGKAGLGVCDGGSVGSGTMEVSCSVLDFETAKQIVEKNLSASRFADYVRIEMG